MWSRANLLLASAAESGSAPSTFEEQRSLNKVESSREQDLALVMRARSGERAAYQTLVEKYQKRAFHIAFEVVRSKEDAEDITQEAFVKAYLSLKSFRGQSAFYTWLYRIVFNLAIDFKRKMARRGGLPAEFEEFQVNNSSADTSVLIGSVEEPDAVLGRKEKALRIQAALGELSESHRTAVLLREFDGMSYEDIAQITGVSRGTVMSRLHYARKHLQKALGDLREDAESVSISAVAARSSS